MRVGRVVVKFLHVEHGGCVVEVLEHALTLRGLESRPPHRCHLLVSGIIRVNPINELVDLDKMAHVGENDPVVPCAAISDEVANLLVDGFDLFGFSPIREEGR